MANVITYGTFDLFHIGHLRLLQRARALDKTFTCVFDADDLGRRWPCGSVGRL